MAISFILGSLLLLWATWDLYTGKVWAHKQFCRKQQPGAFWFTWCIWLLVAFSFLLWS